MDKNTIVVIRTFPTESEALIIKGLLDSAGIASSLVHDDIQSVLPLGNEQTSIGIMVAERDRVRAIEIIDADFDRADFAEQTHTARKPKPASCGCIRRKK